MILNFLCVLNVISFLLGNSQASEFYTPTFRNTLSHLHRQVAMKNDYVTSMLFVTLHSLFLYSDPPLPCHPPCYWLRLFSSQTFSRINTPTFPKPPHIKFRRRRITQKKAYNMVYPALLPLMRTPRLPVID